MIPTPVCGLIACRVLDNILTWAISPFVLGGLCVVLGFLLLVTQGQRSHYKKDKEHLRVEFEQYRHQMQAKVLVAAHACNFSSTFDWFMPILCTKLPDGMHRETCTSSCLSSRN